MTKAIRACACCRTEMTLREILAQLDRVKRYTVDGFGGVPLYAPVPSPRPLPRTRVRQRRIPPRRWAGAWSDA